MLIADELIIELMAVDGELLTAVEQLKTQVTGYAHIRITHTYQKYAAVKSHSQASIIEMMVVRLMADG
jgi:hypothetical protein